MGAPVPELVHRIHGEDVEGLELPDPREMEERVAPQVSPGPPHERPEGGSEKEDAACDQELGADRRNRRCAPRWNKRLRR